MPYDAEAKLRNLDFAKTQLDSTNAKALKSCPCCGELSVVLYAFDFWSPVYTRTIQVAWLKCRNCTYNITSEIHDPYLYGLAKTEMFSVQKKIKKKPGPSERELEVLFLIANNHTNKSAAEQLDLSINTVESHLKNVRKKFGVKSTAAAIYQAMRNKSFDGITLKEI